MNKIKLNREHLIYCRKKLGITKQEAARRMQLSQPAYLRYESGERAPSIHVISFMANILNTSVDFLIGKTNDPKPNSYLIDTNSNPELFTFIELYNSSDDNIKKRIETYVQKIANLI